jgi:pimeloyl-ACP methyl ester carboxylesterase
LSLASAAVANPQIWDQIQLRVSGPANAPALIYFPGLHGDWTLIGSFKAAAGHNVRFAEITYPRTTSWTLAQYADGILTALAEAGITDGWLLLESFGSQIGWQLLKQLSLSGENGTFSPSGIVLAGGFVRYPVLWMVPIVRKINTSIPMPVLGLFCRAYAFYARFRHRRAPETLCDVAAFVKNRSLEEDRRAIAYRYRLIEGCDLCEVASSARIPIYQLVGFFDPIVPWLPVRSWLKRNCAAYRGWRVIFRADHNVLGTAPQESARQVLEWMRR